MENHTTSACPICGATIYGNGLPARQCANRRCGYELHESEKPVPTPEQIRQRCEQVRAGWDDYRWWEAAGRPDLVLELQPVEILAEGGRLAYLGEDDA